MKAYLEGKIEVGSYQQGIFALMKKRAVLTLEEYDVIQTVFVDADDYDPVVRLEHTILEPELRRRVANTIEELAALGHHAG